MLEKVKLALRITTPAFDSELSDLILAALADLGIAGGCGEGLLIRKGEVIRKLPEDQLLSALHAELVSLAKEQGKL